MHTFRPTFWLARNSGKERGGGGKKPAEVIIDFGQDFIVLTRKMSAIASFEATSVPWALLSLSGKGRQLPN